MSFIIIFILILLLLLLLLVQHHSERKRMRKKRNTMNNNKKHIIFVSHFCWMIITSNCGEALKILSIFFLFLFAFIMKSVNDYRVFIFAYKNDSRLALEASKKLILKWLFTAFYKRDYFVAPFFFCFRLQLLIILSNIFNGLFT